MTSFLIEHVRIFTGETVVESGSVLVEGGKIAQVSDQALPFHGKKISKPGHTLLPGLIDVHIHANGGNDVALPQSLRFGTTTVCDMHNEWFNIEKLRRQHRNGGCADLKTTSWAATVDMGWPIPVVQMHDHSEETKAEIATWPKLKTPEDGRKYVQDRVKEGVDYIKLMHESGTMMGKTFNMPSLELQTAIVDEAHKHGLRVVAHATSLQDTLDILSCGVDGLTHTFIDQPPTQELIDAYKKNNAHCNPTLATMASATTEGKPLQEKFAHDPRVARLLGQAERERMCQCMSFATMHSVKYAYDTVRQLKAAGVPILVGSDAAGPAVGTAWGLSAHQEMQILVNDCGFSPIDALRSATSLPAERFRFSDRGRIAQGLRADLLLVEGNPVENIDDTLNIRGVWTEGQLCSTYKDSL